MRKALRTSGLLGCFAFWLCLSGLAHAMDPVPVTIDLKAAPREQKSMVGFLHGLNNRFPTDKWISPLQPYLFRSGLLAGDIYPRAQWFKGKTTVVLSDLWGYGKVAPYDNPNGFKQKMFAVANRWKNRTVVYDLWNEPDLRAYWRGTDKQFFETIKTQHDVIRAIDPDAMIAGPSLHAYDREKIAKFLDFCLEKDLKIDVLSWHEFRTDKKGITNDLQEARDIFLHSPRYAKLGLKEIHINETIDKSITFSPIGNLAVFDALEKGEANAAARTCWRESNGMDNCWSKTLDGLLTNNGLPRSVWWAYRLYTMGLKSRLPVDTASYDLTALASADAEDKNGLFILLGITPSIFTKKEEKVTVIVHLNGASQHLKYLTLFELKDSGEAPSGPPQKLFELALKDGEEGAKTFDLTLTPGNLYLLRR